MIVRAIAALALTLAACSAGTGDATPAPTVEPTQLSVEEASRPGVEITYPVAGADPLPAGDVLVAVTVRSFSIVDVNGSGGRGGDGRVVYYLDVDPIPTDNDATDVPNAGSGRAEVSSMTSHTWPDVSAGRHILGVQLVDDDDRPLDPPVVDSVEIVVGA